MRRKASVSFFSIFAEFQFIISIEYLIVFDERAISVHDGVFVGWSTCGSVYGWYIFCWLHCLHDADVLMFVMCHMLWILRTANISLEKQCGSLGSVNISIEKIV